VEVDLELVNSVRITTLMDKVTDVLMPDHGPARRAAPDGSLHPECAGARAGQRTDRGQRH